MFIKIEYPADKVEMHEVRSYYVNYLAGQKLDLNMHTHEEGRESKHIDDSINTKIYVMNDHGKTIDQI